MCMFVCLHTQRRRISREISEKIKLIFHWFIWVISGIFTLFFGTTAPQWGRAPLFTKFLDHTQRCTTVDSFPLDEWSARGRDIYLTTYNTHNHSRRLRVVSGVTAHRPHSDRCLHTGKILWIIKKTKFVVRVGPRPRVILTPPLLTTDRHPCPPVGFEPKILSGERPQTYALDHAVTETGGNTFRDLKYDVVTTPLSQGPHQGRNEWTGSCYVCTPSIWQVAGL